MNREFDLMPEQVEKLINLTHITLGELEFQFIIAENMDDFKETDFFDLLNNEDKNMLENFMFYTTSLYIQSHNLIVIILDETKGKTYKERVIYFSSNLFHELRHVWQDQKKVFDLSQALQPDAENYRKQPHEVDAICYEIWAVNNFKKEISHIFNIDQNWSIKWKG